MFLDVGLHGQGIPGFWNRLLPTGHPHSHHKIWAVPHHLCVSDAADILPMDPGSLEAAEWPKTVVPWDYRAAGVSKGQSNTWAESKSLLVLGETFFLEVLEFGRKQMDFSDPHHHSETSTLFTFQKKTQRVLVRSKAFPKFLEHGITSDRTIEIIESHVKKPSMLESYLLLTWIQPCVMRLRELKQFEALNIRNLSSKLIALEISFVATQ